MTATDIPIPLRPIAHRSWRQTAAILTPGLLYIGVQGIAVLILWLFTDLNKRPFDLHAWDGDWYLAIAQNGYRGVPTSMLDGAGHHTAYTAMAFFPGYPTLIHLVEPMEGGNFLATALTISVLAGITLAFGVARLATRVTGSHRTGLITSIVVAAAPMSIVYSMVYPEALFLAFAVWALVGVAEKNWPLAGWCAGLAGLVRLDATAVIIVGRGLGDHRGAAWTGSVPGDRGSTCGTSRSGRLPGLGRDRQPFSVDVLAGPGAGLEQQVGRGYHDPALGLDDGHHRQQRVHDGRRGGDGGERGTGGLGVPADPVAAVGLRNNHHDTGTR